MHYQLTSRPFARDEASGDRPKAFARDVIEDVENAEAQTLSELVMDEVERRASRLSCRRRTVIFKP